MAGEVHLSRREAQIARLYADGRSYREIADLLCIAPATVRTHLNSIYRKLEVRSKLQLARFVERELGGDPSGPGSDRERLAPDSGAATEKRGDPSVTNLLQELGLHQYTQVFAANAVDAEVLMSLTDSDLRELGMLIVGHRRRLITAIREQGLSAGRLGGAREEAPRRSTVGPLAERRHLTIMFADLVGSTELSMRLDPEQMRDLLDDYHRAVASEVGRFGGHVANIMGDGSLVYFGWPHAHEDDAERAVWASLAVKGSVGALRCPDGNPLAVRIGIASGVVVVGQGMGHHDAVVGDTPNLASRLQGLAGPDQVVISANSARLLRRAFDIASLGLHRIKGLDQPVEVFEVRRPRAEPERFEARIWQGLADMVGRALELSLLEKCWRRAASGEGQVVLVWGDPGIGKSRLVRALRDSEHVRPVTRATIQCSPYHSQIALFPFAQLLTRSLRPDDDAPRGDERTKLHQLLAGVGCHSQRASLALARLVSLTEDSDPPPLDAREERRTTLEALADLTLGGPYQQPRLILIEDAHWIDPSSHELVHRLVELAATLPVLLVITARPEFTPSWHHGSHASVLNLSRLDGGAAALLIDQIAEPTKLKTEIRDEIVAKADGVPLFVEELTKAVLESDRATHRAPSRLAVASDGLAIPATLHDVLMARLDRMPAAKAVAQTAAAIGRQFEHALLCAAAPWPQALLEEGLDQLVRAGLLLRRGRPPSATYAFKHALIRDEAYHSLLVRDRRQIHGRILRALEQSLDDTSSDGIRRGKVDQLAALARHASLAEFWAEAAHYHHRSGIAARALWAIDEAIGQFRAALHAYERLNSDRSCSGTDEQRNAIMSTRLALCECLYFAGRFQESHELLQGSRHELAAIDDLRLRGRGRYWLARLSSRVGQRGDIRRLAELAIADSLSCGDNATTADAYNVLCVRHFFAGLPDESVAAGRRAISLLESDGPSESLGFAHHYIGMAHLLAGRFRHALDETARVIAIGRALEHPRLACYGRAIDGWALGMLGQHQEGLAHLEHANGIAPDEATRIFTVGYAGCVQLEAGALDESATKLHEAHLACLAFPSPQFAALFGATLADALRRLDRTADAEAAAEKSLDVGRTAEFPFGVGLALRALARLAEARSDRSRAIDLLRQASERLSSAGASFELARTYVDLAALSASDQDQSVTEPYADRAAQLFRRLGFVVTSSSVDRGSRPGSRNPSHAITP